ncbi:hypothetical protein CBL_12109 [Carabus blaptoides fortunei]
MDCSVNLSGPGPSHMTAAPRSSSVDAVTKRKRTLEDDGQENERLVEMRKVTAAERRMFSDEEVTSAVGRIRVRRVSGLDCLRPEVVKCMWWAIPVYMTEL